ncbi:MAG: serine hydrolase [Bryobacteraceae bacterium]
MKYGVWIIVLCTIAWSQDLQKAIADRVDVSRKAVGIAAGVIGPEAREIVVHGCNDNKSEQKLSKESTFEIGSISKVFTALLFADMIERGEVKPDDPVSKYLPESVTVPSRNGKQITLLHLATHVSGLPRLPGNLTPADPANPYADYNAAKLYEFLSGYALPRDPGEKHEYSNLGGGLLGHALSRRAGKPYEELIRQRILEPLQMNETFVGAGPRLATGHSADLRPAKPWDFQVLAPAGAIRSTVGDMLKFAGAHLDLTETPLKAAVARMRQAQAPVGAPDVDQAIGWLIFNNHGTEILLHDGGTAGFRSALALDPARKRGVVVLANTANDVTDIALHELEPKYGLVRPALPRKEIEAGEELLETYVGVYQLTPAFAITIFRKGKQLMAQATNQPAFEVFPESETKFFLKVVDAQISFTKNEAGKVVGLILHQGGRDQKATRTN